MECFRNFPGLIVQDDVEHNVYPLALDAAGTDEVYVGRIRRDYSVENGRMKIRYNSNHVSSKEVLERICATSKIKSLSVRKADLAESIKSLNTGRK